MLRRCNRLKWARTIQSASARNSKSSSVYSTHSVTWCCLDSAGTAPAAPLPLGPLDARLRCSFVASHNVTCEAAARNRSRASRLATSVCIAAGALASLSNTCEAYAVSPFESVRGIMCIVWIALMSLWIRRALQAGASSLHMVGWSGPRAAFCAWTMVAHSAWSYQPCTRMRRLHARALTLVGRRCTRPVRRATAITASMRTGLGVVAVGR